MADSAVQPLIGIERAVSEVEVEDFSRVHGYLIALYRAYIRRFVSGGPKIEVLRHVLRKLDTVANQVLRAGRWRAGAVCKLQSWSIVPINKIFPLVWKVLRTRVVRNSHFTST
jgi:hypothetical protein